ncbi:MAG: radical SAM protein [Myxococcaceae bacterium]
MDVARIRLNDTCNLACAFCNARADVETPSFAAAGAVKQRIDAALRSGAKQLVLTGGEPTLRRDLPDIVRYCAQNDRRVTLETNALLIDGALAARLKAAGLAHALVHPVTAQTRDGLRALHDAGVTLEAVLALTRTSAPSVASWPAEVRAIGVPLAGLVAVIPVESPAPGEVLDLRDAGRLVEQLDTAARHEGLPLRLADGVALPPCQVDAPARLSHLFHLSRGGAQRDDCARRPGCTDCVVASMCPGLPLAAPAAQERPLHGEALRRRLSSISSFAEQIDRELVTRTQRNRGQWAVREHIVRINFRCNQACRFCFVSTHLPSAEDRAIEAAILDVAREGGVVTLSGGEPTLNPKLEQWVRLAKSSGASLVELQTNATKLGDRALTERLVAAGVDVAFVSLHGSTAAVSDVVTGAPGTFDETVRGLDELHLTSVKLLINFVLCEANYRDFPAFIELLGARWPRATVNVSFVAPSTDVVPRETSLIPRYTDAMPFLADGLRATEKLGLTVVGFDSMCGLPLCLVPTDVSKFFTLGDAPDSEGEFEKPETCRACSLQRECFGLRRGYAELYGTGELRAVTTQS